jgi:putative salt-induced outer membrane protein YdiY
MKNIFLLSFLFNSFAFATTNEVSTAINFKLDEGNAKARNLGINFFNGYFFNAKNKLSAKANLNRGQALDSTSNKLELSVFNYLGSLRYDYFATKYLGIFGAVSYFHDEFTGINYRVDLDLGLTLTVLQATKESRDALSFDVGYRYSRESLMEKTVVPADYAKNQHKIRLAANGVKDLSKDMYLTALVEGTYKVKSPTRINFMADLGFNIALSNMISFKLGYVLKYDDYLPTLNKEKLDHSLTFSLLGNIKY